MNREQCCNGELKCVCPQLDTETISVCRSLPVFTGQRATSLVRNESHPKMPSGQKKTPKTIDFMDVTTAASHKTPLRQASTSETAVSSLTLICLFHWESLYTGDVHPPGDFTAMVAEQQKHSSAAVGRNAFRWFSCNSSPKGEGVAPSFRCLNVNEAARSLHKSPRRCNGKNNIDE